MARVLYISTVKFLGRLWNPAFGSPKASRLHWGVPGVRMVQTDFLFAEPSCFSGAARALDLFGQFDSYNSTRTPSEADALALFSDWVIVGQDLMTAARGSESSEMSTPDVAESALVATQ